MKRILLVEDTIPLAEEIEDILRLEGFTVVTATNATVALKNITTMIPDLILTDLLMPGMDGFQFIEQIRSISRLADIPIIILSASTANEDRIRGKKSGANAFVAKPCKAHELIATINLLLDNPAA